MSTPSDPQLETALSTYAAALPRHARLIQLAGEVLRQSAAVQAGLALLAEVAQEAAEDKRPATPPILSDLSIPPAVFHDFLHQLLGLFLDYGLLPRLDQDLCRCILKLPPQVWLKEAAEVADICRGWHLSAGLFLFLGQKALAPFYQHAAAPFRSSFLNQEDNTGRCPSCGQEPALATLAEGSGQRFLYCSLCGVQWPALRHTCVFCGIAATHFSYLFVENDPARRADFCQACGRYCKTIVISRLPHALYLPLEEFVTVDLDAMLAHGDVFP
jgi:transcription elongation factor Elf1